MNFVATVLASTSLSARGLDICIICRHCIGSIGGVIFFILANGGYERLSLERA
jgi:hypothetical protein